MITNLTPKADYLTDAARAGRHQDLMFSPEFKRAAEIAFTEYAMKLGGDAVDNVQLASVGLRLEGAKGVLKELLNLGQPSAPYRSPIQKSLEPT